MPHSLSSLIAGEDDVLRLQETESELQHKSPRKPSFLKGIGSFWKRQQQRQEVERLPQLLPLEQAPLPECFPRRHRSLQDNYTNTHADGLAVDRQALQEDFEQRWILNLSMHFRDKSNREKFFVTYAETPAKWRRITISLDYRNAPEGSLEADLSALQYPREKSFRIFEDIRESLPDIQYYDTVTNLKLETTPDDDQLHVHVREDANEIINFPSTSLFQHVQMPLFTESEVEFLSHLSGFVYKVRAGGRMVIKKEIPGPDSVDEFLYEVNALDALHGCPNVIALQGLVTDDSGSIVKGLLISYASNGALVDLLYDYHGELPWHRREKWAKQIVQGLSSIHEAGFVQGDFTLSNIVIDDADNAQIIDINRRGCPVGWEPPELSKLIDSGQRIGMCIGVKTDLFQLGMVLWALAEETDEPERLQRPLPPPSTSTNTPLYFHQIIATCLSERPQNRLPANRLLTLFPSAPSASSSAPHSRPPSPNANATSTPDLAETKPMPTSHPTRTSSVHRSDKEYIDPSLAITLDEVLRRRRADSGFTDFAASGQVTYLDPKPKAAAAAGGDKGSLASVWTQSRAKGYFGRSVRGLEGDAVAVAESVVKTRDPPSSLEALKAGAEVSVQGVLSEEELELGFAAQEGQEKDEEGRVGMEMADAEARRALRSPAETETKEAGDPTRSIEAVTAGLLHMDFGFHEQAVAD
ncbi:hypothetical protein B0A50_02272 [Salinomyces thailandicus]|uniref:Protein kinase domain-containing protein n=1 Tax=Salinomyces thailandicus TaxID=706561 RepID=A0A4U0UAX8_9PEZI|nr:hypothetical protein B0A50_02272 [Salinomyces thailandica]